MISSSGKSKYCIFRDQPLHGSFNIQLSTLHLASEALFDPEEHRVSRDRHSIIDEVVVGRRHLSQERIGTFYLDAEEDLVGSTRLRDPMQHHLARLNLGNGGIEYTR